MSIRIELQEDELRAVLELVGPFVSEYVVDSHGRAFNETEPIYRAERALDSALLAHEQAAQPNAMDGGHYLHRQGWTN